MAPARQWFRRAWPVVCVVAVLLALMYPVALLLGMPLARQRMENLSNWERASVAALPVAEADAGGSRLPLGAGPTVDAVVSGLQRGSAVLVRGEEVLATGVSVEGTEAVLPAPLPGPAVRLGPAAGPVEGPDPDLSGRVYALPDATPPGAPLYLDGSLLVRGSLSATERADGVRTSFTVPGLADAVAGSPDAAVAIVGDAPVVEGAGFERAGDVVTFARAPAFNAPVRLITGDYASLDEDAGTIVLAEPAEDAPRIALEHVAVVEGLTGAYDGENRDFRLQHVPLLERDPGRRLFVGGRELTGGDERPAERVDGVQRSFTFASDHGIVTAEGRQLVEDLDYQRDGNVVTFATPPTRNAALRQHPDYLVSDASTGTITLAAPPAPGEPVWALSYTYYSRPGCGATAFECFLSMPQHPVPFPNWIAERIVPFFTAYPFSDSRNVIRATLYTAAGTLVSLAFGTLIGVLLAVLFVRVRPFERALLPWVIASQTIPVIALVPVLVAVLGNMGVTVQTSLVPAAIVGAYIAFFPVTVGTVTGLRSVDPLALDLMKAYAASPLQSFLKLRFPAAVPYLFTSLKLGAAAALVGALVAEVESNNRLGLGYAIIGQVQAGDVADVWILLVISALLGIGLVSLVGLLQRLVAPWERTGLGGADGAG